VDRGREERGEKGVLVLPSPLNAARGLDSALSSPNEALYRHAHFEVKIKHSKA